MNKYLLFLLTLFITWLFYTSCLFESGLSRLFVSFVEEKRIQQQTAEHLKNLEIQSSLKERYVIYDNPNSTTEIILDKQTGMTWRYFRNLDKDGSSVKDEGWMPLMYDIEGYKGQTSEIAVENMNNGIANMKPYNK